MKWEPMETAPKDGTFCLIYVYNPPCVAQYKKNRRSGEEWWETDSGETFPKDKPSYWMPLPEPPKS